MQRVVVCCGTFDGDLHPGHRFFLNEVRKHGDFMVVFINSERVVFLNKHRKPIYSQQERVANVRKLGIADKVLAFADTDQGQLDQIEALHPAVYCDGALNDYVFWDMLTERLSKLGTDFVRVPRIGEYSTTRLHFS